MPLSDDDEITFNRNGASSFDATPLPALAKKDAPDEELDEDERLKREIWAEVEAAKAERLEREAKEKKRRAAERKKAAARNSAGRDGDVSQKVLEARKKREEDSKRFRQLRMQGKQKKPQQSDLIVVSPSKSPAASRRPDVMPDVIIATKPAPKAVAATAVAEEEPASPAAEPSPPAEETVTPPASKASTRRTLTPSGTDSAQKWKRAYQSVKSKYEAELEGKEKMEQALAQYDKTISTLMEQKAQQDAKIAALEEGATKAADDLSEDRVAASEAKAASAQAQLEVVQAQLQQLKAEHEALVSSSKAEKVALKKKVESLQVQVTAGAGDGDVATKMAKFQEASARHVEVLQLQQARYQTQNKTLQTLLDARTQENQDLTQICDQLVKMLEASQA